MSSRYKLLVDKNEIPRQQYDTAVRGRGRRAGRRSTARKAAVREAEQNIAVAQSAVDQAEQRIPQADASIESAMTAPQQVQVSEARAKSALAQVAQKKALLDQAKLNLSYCTIVAPVTGIVGKKTVELGQNISPGQQLMAVVPLDDIWVTANFKETQLNRMKPGQRVRFSVDAYGKEYTRQDRQRRRRQRFAIQPAASRKRDRELREGGAAHSGSHQPRPRPERRSPAAPRHVGRSEGLSSE